MHKNRVLFRVIAILLVVVSVFPVNVLAAEAETVQPRASYYLSSYSAYVYPAGSGRVEVYFSVNGTNIMDEIGALTIQLYESKDNTNWTWVKTYASNYYSNMLEYDDYYHGSYVTYQGIGGRFYKAYICVWAGKDGGGDTRYFWTSARQAI